MKQTDWQMAASMTKELFPAIMQIATYSRNRWILVFENEPDSFLNTFHPLAELIRKHKLPNPLIVNVKFIQTSLDSYPLEFLDIQCDYTNLYVTDDALKDLHFSKDDIRLEIERELKSKWLLTRLSALDYHNQPARLFRLLKESFNALMPVFKGFCYIAGITVPKDANQLISALEEILHCDLKVLHYIHTQKKAPSLELMVSLFNDYIRLLNSCGEQIDCWKQA